MNEILEDLRSGRATIPDRRLVIYIQPEEREAARQLADLYQGGNISRLIRRLIRNAQENPDLAKERAA